MEIWDAYDREGNKLGYDIVRDVPIQEGVYHKVAEIIVKHNDGSYLAMQRSMNKVGYPGLYEISAGGSILKGETPEEGARRELFEETGIQSEEFKHVYQVVRDESHTIFDGFITITDVPKDEVVLQEEETMGFRWIDENEVKTFAESELHVTGKHLRILPYL